MIPEYGIYIQDIDEGIPVSINMSGFTGKVATEILGEVWEDEYTGYVYEPGDERVIEMYFLDPEPELLDYDEYDYGE